MTVRRRSARLGAAAFAWLVAMVVLAAPLSALAAEPPVALSLTPTGQRPGTFFELEMRPGEVRRLSVELDNVGARPIRARTYAADVYSTVNGGFGASLRDEPHGGTTDWISYASEVLELGARAGTTRRFSVRVPPAATAGEYITSLVLENEDPIAGRGQVALDQIIRQAVAVVVTVPGPARPGLAVGGATHAVVAGRSVVAVGVENIGNRHLVPAGTFILRDAEGREVSRSAVSMDSVYSRTATSAEIPLAALLAPGAYTVSISLADATYRTTASADAIPLLVGDGNAPAGDDGAAPPGAPDTATGDQAAGALPGGLGLEMFAVLIVAAAGIGMVGLVVARPRRRPRRS